MGSERSSNDTTSLQPSEPTLCSNGCGFFGAAATMGLCSKCYRDLMVQESQTAQAKSAVEKSLSPPASAIETTKKAVASSAAAENEKIDGGLERGAEEKKAVKNRCGKCNKKVGLTGFQCRCGHTFCGSHRYAEEHECDFDFKGKGKSEIAKANPVVRAAKLEKF